MNESVVAAMEVMLRPGADPLAVSVACEAVIGWAHSRQLDAIHQVAEESPEFFDPTGALVDPAPAEIACALHWSAGAASRRVDLAASVCTDLPGLLTALREGRLDLPKAEEIATGTCELDPNHRRVLADRAITYASGHTRAQLRAWLSRQVAAIDPEAVARRRKKAVRARRVWIQPEPDGMATIGAYLSAEEAQVCWNALTAGAASIEGAVDPARADMFVCLLTGAALGQPVPVQVIITSAGPELAGHGPISPSHATELCTHADLINLTTPKPSTGYKPAPSLARWVRTRDRHCRFPGCRRPATMCDLDHVIAYPTGRTHHANLATLCRYHHRLKTHTPWTVRMLPNAVLAWTSPRGHTFHTSL
ncbi:MAG: DUF222 domain-containing protein, partial [Candidatus Nanopelagicales bacterium]